MIRFLIPLALFLVVAVFLAVGLDRDPRKVPSPLIDKPAPAFVAPVLSDGTKMLRREDMLGKVWLLNVWASWCVACRDEHPLLVEFARRGKVPVVGLNYKDRREDGLAWLARHGDPYAVSVFDPEGRVGIDYGVYGVPETFVIDRKGVLRYKHVGALTPDVMAKRIAPLLAELDG